MATVNFSPDTRKAFIKASVVMEIGGFFCVAAIIVAIIAPRSPIGIFAIITYSLLGVGLIILLASAWWIYKFNILYRRDKVNAKTDFRL